MATRISCALQLHAQLATSADCSTPADHKLLTLLLLKLLLLLLLLLLRLLLHFDCVAVHRECLRMLQQEGFQLLTLGNAFRLLDTAEL